MKNLKEKIQNGDTLIGTFLSLGNSVVTEMIGQAGFNFVIIDQEHGIGNEQSTLNQLQALEASETAAIVRIESVERQRANRVLDLGAEGIMFPQVKTFEDAHKATEAMYYPPHGVRGVAKLVRASSYAKNFKEYYSRQKQDLIGIVQVETEEILSNRDEIASLDGTDLLFVGPMDLSMALGCFGDFKNPRFVEALEATAKAAKKHGKACGMLLPTLDYLKPWHNMGYRFFTGGGDLGFLNVGAQNMVADMKTNIAKL